MNLDERGRKEMPRPWLRDGEVFLFYTRFDAGVCTRTGKTLAESMVCWDHRISSGPGYQQPWQLGEDSFTVIRHVDGSPCVVRDGELATSCVTQPRCPVCRQFNTARVNQEAYGDRVTCSSPGCDYSQFFSIGD